MEGRIGEDGALVLYGDATYPASGVAHNPSDMPSGYVYENPFGSPHDFEEKPAERAAEQPKAEGESKKKKRKLHPFLKGIVILTVSPFVMAGVVIVAAGTIVYGTGQLIVGVGDIMTGGPLKKTARKAWEDRKNAKKATV